MTAFDLAACLVEIGRREQFALADLTLLDGGQINAVYRIGEDRILRLAIRLLLAMLLRWRQTALQLSPLFRKAP